MNSSDPAPSFGNAIMPEEIEGAISDVFSLQSLIEKIAAFGQEVAKDATLVENDISTVFNALDANIGVIATVVSTVAGILAFLPTNPALALVIVDLNLTTQAINAYIAARNAGMSVEDAFNKGLSAINQGLATIAAAIEQWGQAILGGLAKL